MARYDGLYGRFWDDILAGRVEFRGFQGGWGGPPGYQPKAPPGADSEETHRHVFHTCGALARQVWHTPRGRWSEPQGLRCLQCGEPITAQTITLAGEYFPVQRPRPLGKRVPSVVMVRQNHLRERT